MSTFNVLITGTKAGIGQGLLSAYATRPGTVVIAAVRDAPDSRATAKMISSITSIGDGSSIIPVQYDAAKETAGRDMVVYLQEKHPEIKHIDLVVANAGMADYWGPCNGVPAEDVSRTYTINAIGPVLLYHATRDLLLRSRQAPKFFVVTSVVGSISVGPFVGFDIPSYGMSKAAINWFIRKANAEEERLTIAAVSPGWTQTDMGQRAADKLNQTAPPMPLEQCIAGLLKVFDTATKDESKDTLFTAVPDQVLQW